MNAHVAHHRISLLYFEILAVFLLKLLYAVAYVVAGVGCVFPPRFAATEDLFRDSFPESFGATRG